MNIIIGGVVVNCDVASTPEQKKKGLQGVVNLDDNKGMIFINPSDEEISMWMDKTFIKLDIIFINSFNKIIKIVNRNPNNRHLSTSKAKYVLELKGGFCKKNNVTVGDVVIFNEENSLILYDESGNKQMNMQGEERIFSRISTKKILELVNKKDLLQLGKYVVKEVNAQNKRKPEYVKQ